jgi:hypothetical protein
MGMKVPYSMDTKISAEATVWGSGKIFGRSVPRTGEPDIRRASMPGPGAYAARDTAEIRCSASSRIYQREKCNSDSPEICGERKKLHGTELLGEGVVCITVGPEEATIRKYIQRQEDEDRHQDQLEMFKDK